MKNNLVNARIVLIHPWFSFVLHPLVSGAGSSVLIIFISSLILWKMLFSLCQCVQLNSETVNMFLHQIYLCNLLCYENKSTMINCIHQQGFVVAVMFQHHVCFPLVFSSQERLPPLPGWQPQMHTRSPPSVCGWTTWLLHKDLWNNRADYRKWQPDHKRLPSFPLTSCLLGWKRVLLCVYVNGILTFTSETQGLILMQWR